MTRTNKQTQSQVTKKHAIRSSKSHMTTDQDLPDPNLMDTTLEVTNDNQDLHIELNDFNLHTPIYYIFTPSFNIKGNTIEESSSFVKEGFNQDEDFAHVTTENSN